MLQFVGRRHDVECDGDGADPQGGKIGNHELRAVSQRERDLVAFAGAQGLKMSGQRVHKAVEVAVTDLMVVKNKSRLFWIKRGRVLQQAFHVHNECGPSFERWFFRMLSGTKRLASIRRGAWLVKKLSG